MTYEEFKRAWIGALHHSGLAVFGSELIREGLDLLQVDRSGETTVALRDPQVEPFTIVARTAWRWASSHSARTATSEEDLVAELVGIKSPRPRRTERPWLRIDATLRASLPYNRALPFPAERWAAWGKHTTKAIAELDPRPTKVNTGLPPTLKWQGTPAAKVRADGNGTLRVEAIELDAWQGVALPRRWSDPRRKPDPHPGPALDKLFKRLEDALHIWTHATIDLLVPRSTQPITAVEKRRPVVETTQPLAMATPGSSSAKRVPPPASGK